jgi:hypothetical protein
MSNAEYNERQFELEKEELRERYEVEAETQAARLKGAWARIAELETRIADYEDDFQAVVAEECAPDEKHCSCVPHLRRRINELEDAQIESLERIGDMRIQREADAARITYLEECVRVRDEMKHLDKLRVPMFMCRHCGAACRVDSGGSPECYDDCPTKTHPLEGI